MLSFADLATRPDFTVTAVTCRGDHKAWSEVESPGLYRLVLVRRGRFRRRSSGVTAELDPSVAYVGVPGEEEHFAHPAGGDVCTLVSLSPAMWNVLAGEASQLTTSTVSVDSRLDLAHRRLLATARAGDIDDGLAEDLVDLVGHVIPQVVDRPTRTRARPSAADHGLVTAARRAIVDGHPESNALFPLAQLLGVSPYRLSRAFTRELGVSLTRYRNRVRIGRAMDRLENGEIGLAALAADLGFADQPHLTRTVREQLGHTPRALRRLLRGPSCP